MSRATRSVTVHRPVDQVFAAWEDFPSFPDFLSDVESVVSVGPGRTRWKVSVGGQALVFEALVTEDDPGRRIAWSSTGGDVDHSGAAEFRSTGDDATDVEVRIDWEPSGLGERLGALVQVPEVAIGRQLDQFKEHLERSA